MVSPPETAISVALVPADSSAREPLIRAAARVGLRVAEQPKGAAIILVDLTAAGSGPALAALLDTGESSRALLLALVDPGEDAFASLEPLKPADVITSAVPHELAYRLQRLAERYREREEQSQLQKDLSLLLELTADYAESFDVEALLHDVTRRLALQMDISRASLVMLDDGRARRASSSPPAMIRALKDRRIELARYPEIREVVRTGQPVVVENAPNHPLLEGVHSAGGRPGHPRHRRAARCPSAGRCAECSCSGASGRRRTFAAREIDFLTTVSHATAIALRNASVLENVRGQTEREKSARIAAEEQAAALRTYRLFFANVGDGVAILDDKASVLSLNPAGRVPPGHLGRAGARAPPAPARPDGGRGGADGDGQRRRPRRDALQTWTCRCRPWRAGT